jgi:hypothetical protein
MSVAAASHAIALKHARDYRLHAMIAGGCLGEAAGAARLFHLARAKAYLMLARVSREVAIHGATIRPALTT